MVSVTSIPESQWYLATSKPKQECRAIENLKNQGINAFSPTIKVEKIRAGKKLVVEETMFTGYLFINLSPEDGLWHKIRSTRGIRDWVRFSGKAARIPTQLVSQLIEQQQSQEKTIVKSTFKPGEEVRILSGPFEGLKGIYLAQNGEERALILIEFLGKQNRLKLANEQIVSE